MNPDPEITGHIGLRGGSHIKLSQRARGELARTTNTERCNLQYLIEGGYTGILRPPQDRSAPYPVASRAGGRVEAGTSVKRSRRCLGSDAIGSDGNKCQPVRTPLLAIDMYLSVLIRVCRPDPRRHEARDLTAHTPRARRLRSLRVLSSADGMDCRWCVNCYSS